MTKTGSDCCEMPLKTTEEDAKEIQEATVSRDAVRSSGSIRSGWHFHIERAFTPASVSSVELHLEEFGFPHPLVRFVWAGVDVTPKADQTTAFKRTPEQFVCGDNVIGPRSTAGRTAHFFGLNQLP